MNFHCAISLCFLMYPTPPVKKRSEKPCCPIVRYASLADLSEDSITKCRRLYLIPVEIPASFLWYKLRGLGRQWWYRCTFSSTKFNPFHVHSLLICQEWFSASAAPSNTWIPIIRGRICSYRISNFFIWWRPMVKLCQCVP